MIIFLTGHDTFRSRERLRQLRAAFMKKFDPTGLNITTFEGSALTFEDFRSSVLSQGFFTSRRFVVVERPFEADRKVQDALTEFIRSASIPEEIVVVFWDGAAEQKKKKKEEETPVRTLATTLARVKQREQFDLLTPVEVERWIRKRIQDRGGTIDRESVTRLAASAGSDLWRLANELEKLFHQTKGKITGADVEDDTGQAVEENIFAFTDALGQRNERLALKLLEDQFTAGANELYLLTMIARQVGILLSISDVSSREPNPATIATRLNLHPYVVKKSLQQIRMFTVSELIAAHDRLVDIDRQIKSSRTDPRVLLESFVASICRTSARQPTL